MLDKIEVTINTTIPQNATWFSDKDTISLSINFHSFQDLEDYLKGKLTIFQKTELIYEIDPIPLFDASTCFPKLKTKILSMPVQLIINPSDIIDWENYSGICLTIYTNLLPFKEVAKLLDNPYLNSNCRFIDKYNSDTILTLEDMRFMYAYYTCLKETTKDLSPAEICYYVYDIVRSQEYKAEEPDEDVALSRDLNKTLLGDKIVCLGYANQMCAALNFLGINAEVQYWRSTINVNNGHASVIVYLSDPKYNINGIFDFEPTADRKKNADDTNYINACANGFIPYRTSIKIHNAHNLEEDIYSTISRLTASMQRYDKLINLISPQFLVVAEVELCLKRHNQICSLLEHPTLESNNTKQITNAASRFTEFREIIPEEQLLEIFRSVRNVEHAVDPELFSNNEEDIQALCKTTLSARISARIHQQTINLLRALKQKS